MRLQKRYLLSEVVEIFQWSSTITERRWLAHETERGVPVTICDIMLPLASTQIQPFIRSATRTFLAAGQSSCIPSLQTLFMEHGHLCFVFTHHDGPSLQTLVERQGMVAERDAILWYRQGIEVLHLLAQQHPPVVHGLIRPDHLLRGTSQWMWTPGSILLAGGGASLLMEGLASAYTAPEAREGMYTSSSDLYALAATIVYALTGGIPPGGPVGPLRQHIPLLSPTFYALLERSLHPERQQRYQYPAEVLAYLSPEMQSQPSRVPMMQTTVSPGHTHIESGLRPTYQQFPEASAIRGPSAGDILQAETASLLPRPQDLPLIPSCPEGFLASCWVIGVVLCLAALLFIIT